MNTDILYTRCPVPTASGIAVEHGLFKQMFADSNYTVKNIKDQENPNLNSHFDHSADNLFREGGGSPPIWARANGAATRLLAITFMSETLGIYVRADDAARGIEDLAGRRCALPVWPTLAINFFRFAAEKGFYSALSMHGMSDADVHYVDVCENEAPNEMINPTSSPGEPPRKSSYYSQMQALCDSHVDAIFAKGSECAILEREAGDRIRRLFDVRSSPNMADRVNNSSPRLLTVSESLLQEHPQAVVSYVRMLVRAALWAQDHPQEAAKVVAVEAGTSAENIETFFEVGFHLKFMPKLNPELLESLSVMKTFLFDRGYIDNDFSVDDWLAPEPLREACALEGVD